jgi:hypothetical protein
MDITSITQIRDESQTLYNKLLKIGTNSDNLTSITLLNVTLEQILLCEIWLKLNDIHTSIKSGVNEALTNI